MNAENATPIRETDRLVLRPLSPHDLPGLAPMLRDPEVMRHSIGGVRDGAGTRRFIEWARSCYESHGLGPWALIDRNGADFVGFCGIGPESVGREEAFSLGYRLARQYWRRGLASEAVKAALHHAFTDAALDTVATLIEPEHVTSLRVAEKAGFRRFQTIEFHARSVRLYRLTREEWTRMAHDETPGGGSSCRHEPKTPLRGEFARLPLP